MGSAHRLRFVDRSGIPFSMRYSMAIRQLSHSLWRQYPQILDETDQDNAMEETLRRAAHHEGTHGKVENLPSLIRRIFPHVISTMFLRKGYYTLHEEGRAAGEIDTLSTSSQQSSESLERIVYIRELLSKLDERERLILSLYARGLKGDQIAKQVDVTVDNVYQIIHRIRERLKRFT